MFKKLLDLFRPGNICKDCRVKTEQHNPVIHGSVDGIPLRFHNIHFENLCASCTMARIDLSFNEGRNVSNQPCLYYPQEQRTLTRAGSITQINEPGKICVLLGSVRWGDSFVSRRAIAALLTGKKL